MAKLLEEQTRDGSVVVQRDVRIPTRDGGFGAADVDRPVDAWIDEPTPPVWWRADNGDAGRL